jgi:hypothetical protein
MLHVFKRLGFTTHWVPGGRSEAVLKLVPFPLSFFFRPEPTTETGSGHWGQANLLPLLQSLLTDNQIPR